MLVGGSHLVIHLKLPQRNISCQKSMSVGGSHLVIHLKLPQRNISCQKSMSVGGSHLVIHLKLPQCNIFLLEVYVGWWLALCNSPKTVPQCNIS